MFRLTSASLKVQTKLFFRKKSYRKVRYVNYGCVLLTQSGRHRSAKLTSDVCNARPIYSHMLSNRSNSSNGTGWLNKNP